MSRFRVSPASLKTDARRQSSSGAVKIPGFRPGLIKAVHLRVNGFLIS
jgi:hypothetical protein